MIVQKHGWGLPRLTELFCFHWNLNQLNRKNESDKKLTKNYEPVRVRSSAVSTHWLSLLKSAMLVGRLSIDLLFIFERHSNQLWRFGNSRKWLHFVLFDEEALNLTAFFALCYLLWLNYWITCDETTRRFSPLLPFQPTILSDATELDNNKADDETLIKQTNYF